MADLNGFNASQVDPSVEFGLRFETQTAEEDPDDEPPAPEDSDDTPEPVGADAGDAEVVRLDSFRKGH